MKIDLLEYNLALVDQIPITAIQIVEYMCRKAGICVDESGQPNRIKLAEWSEEEGFVFSDMNGNKFSIGIEAFTYVPPKPKPVFDEDFSQCNWL